MTTTRARTRVASGAGTENGHLPAALDRRFEAIAFDWDGTAVRDRRADASRVRRLVEALCERGMEVAVIADTNVANVDRQLAARPVGPGRLQLLLNRGSEVFTVGPHGPRLRHRRRAAAAEDRALTAAAELAAERLAARGLKAELVSGRLNRRKLDLIPEPEWADPPKARIGQLLRAVERRLRASGIDGLQEAVAIARDAAADVGLADAKITSDAKHVEIGLTDKADSARWLFEDLWRRGVAPDQVLVVGDEFGDVGGLGGSDSFLLSAPGGEGATSVSVGREPTGVPVGVLHLGGGPRRLLGLLDDQLRRRGDGEMPLPARDPEWTVTIEGIDPDVERAHETLLTLADGVIGTTGSRLAPGYPANPRVLVSGVYAGAGAASHLVACPRWSDIGVEGAGGEHLARSLDLRTGMLFHEASAEGGVHRALLFSSLRRPGTGVVRTTGDADEAPALVDSTGSTIVDHVEDGENVWYRVAGEPGGVAIAAAQSERPAALERFAAYTTSSRRVPPLSSATHKLARARTAGFDRLLAEHRHAWARRWETADVIIEGDPELQQAVRFGLFHLMASVPDRGEAAVGARGISGRAYRGHVFWDSDVFVLPFLAATHPPAARAMLEYRVRRLAAAQAHAARMGRRGARFPWESAYEGIDVTPTFVYDKEGRVVPIRTGQLEEHITADVAWAASFYCDWTADRAFEAHQGRTLLEETARYWASRARLEQRGGRAHIYGVIGPDEYHEPVDDNAFTNVMARWNLERAAALPGTDARERDGWLRIARALVDGYDPTTGLYEQFSGFYALEPLIIADVAPRRPVTADVLLGRPRVQRSQVLKQADVLMLHHLVPDAVEPGTLEPNLAFYEPRTAHGSSLSPAIHASLFARAGKLEEAVELLRTSSRLDLDDVTSTTAEGLHLATMGGVWQALAFGFAGVRVAGDAVVVDPRLPEAWKALELRLRFRGSPLRLRIEPDGFTVQAAHPVPVAVGNEVVRAGRGGVRFRRRERGWIEAR